MDKKNFYKEQALKFRDYEKRFPKRDFFRLFEQWADSKDFTDEDKKEIWKLVKEHGQ